MKPFGRYQLLRRLAAGGMAEVFLATGPNPINAELLAIKLIHAHIAEDPGFMAMFVDEARVTAPLAHPNVVRIFDLGQTDARLYLAMEFIRGYPLQQIRQRAEARGLSIGPARAAAIAEQAARGLHAAHEARGPNGELLNVVHRDISPQNLMLDQDGVVKVVDFGVAKAAGQLATSQKGGLKGKAGYSAPEQLRHRPIDRRADIYALGSVLFQLATGEALFPGKSEAEILQRMLFEPLPEIRGRRDLPAELGSVILKAISPEPDARFPTAHALAQALSSYLEKVGTGRTQLASFMGQLFPPLPRTVQEAMEETSPSNPRITGGTPVVTRPPPSSLPPPSEEPTTTVGRAALETTRPDRAPLDPEGTIAAPAPSLQATRPDQPPLEHDPPTLAAPTPQFGNDDPVPTLAGAPPSITAREPAIAPGRRRTAERSVSNVTEPSGNQLARPAEPSEDTTTTSGALARDLDNENDTRTETKPAPPPRRPSAIPPWIWLGVGAAAGLLAVGIYLGVRRPEPRLAAREPVKVPPPQVAPTVPTTPPPTVHEVAIPDPPRPEPQSPQSKTIEGDKPHKPITGTLTVLASPWAKVRVDGKEIGVTPLYRKVVTAGRHKLELTNPKVKAKKVVEIVVAPHKENVQKIVLERRK